MALEQYLVQRLSGVSKTVVKATVRKTIQVKQYEPEVIELTCEQEYDRDFSPLELALVSEMSKLGIEFSLQTQLFAMDQVSKEEFVKRKEIMLTVVTNLMNKLEKEQPDSTVLKEMKDGLNELSKKLENKEMI